MTVDQNAKYNFMVANTTAEDADGVQLSLILMISAYSCLKKIIAENDLKMKLFKENCVTCTCVCFVGYPSVHYDG